MRTIHTLLAAAAVFGWALMFLDGWHIVEHGTSIFPSLLTLF